MADLDPAAIRRAHGERTGYNGFAYCADGCGDWPCEPYRLADALEAEQARTARLWATWEPYDTDDEGNVPWRLQRDMRAAYTDNHDRATTARVRSEPQSRPRENDWRGCVGGVVDAAHVELCPAPHVDYLAWLNSRGVDDGLG